MAVDTSKLRKSGRRGLGVPPTDGSPGIEEIIAPIPEAAPAGPVAVPLLTEDATAHQLRATSTPRQASAAEEQYKGKSMVLQRLQRVPPHEVEPRIPFTTRVSLSTKERLEDACHFLRKKHQDFINDAIIAHLEKHKF